MILQPKNIEELWFLLPIAHFAMFNNITATGAYLFYLLLPVLQESELNFKGLYVLLVSSVQFILGIWVVLFILSMRVRLNDKPLFLFSIFSIILSSVYLIFSYFNLFHGIKYAETYSALEFCAHSSVVFGFIFIGYLLMRKNQNKRED